MNILEQFYRMQYVVIYNFAEAQIEIVLFKKCECITIFIGNIVSESQVSRCQGKKL